MRLQVLVDNNTFIDEYYLGEPAASYYVEVGGCRILFDAGYSDAVLRNAGAMGIDLGALTHIVISHGHDDHTNGLMYLKDAADLSRVQLIAHPDCFNPRRKGEKNFGPPCSTEQISAMTRFKPSKTPLWLTESCVFLGQIPRTTDFENKAPLGEIQLDGDWRPDYLLDDSAMACRTAEGLFIITGCSHSGICNIVRYASDVCGDSRIVGIIGGFHLRETGAKLDATAQWLLQAGVKTLYPGHCVSLCAKFVLMQVLNVREVGVGLTVELD